jgi:hypothetical protein
MILNPIFGEVIEQGQWSQGFLDWIVSTVLAENMERHTRTYSYADILRGTTVT